MTSNVQWVMNPFDIVVECYVELYNKPCEIHFTKGLKEQEDKCGFTNFPDDDSQPQIVMDAALPYEGLVEILAHELAHVVVGHDAESDPHGPLWNEAFDKLHELYCQKVDAVYGEELSEGKEIE